MTGKKDWDLPYRQIFQQLVRAAYEGNLPEKMAELERSGDELTRAYVKYASGGGDACRVVHQINNCRPRDCPFDDDICQASCLFNGIVRDMQGNVVIDYSQCTDCGQCVEQCRYQCLLDRKEFVPLVEILKDKKVPVFAIMAPAYIGQFGLRVTPGKLRAALKRLGFYGMVEVALFADILTFKEALEFDRHIRYDRDFLLTSCCCPIWVSMVKKVYHQLVPHISPSVSPMVACGRGIKQLHPDAKIVFIGPCLAKKAEAKEPDVADAVDAVLTFQELQDIFTAMHIDPAEMPEDPSEHSSTAGRIYARTGGVSQAVAATLERLRPERAIKIKAVQANGVAECKKLLSRLLAGELEANFFEGMGCVGGCVGGPRALLPVDRATQLVNDYGQVARYYTPVDNRFVLELLARLGITELEQLLDEENGGRIFVRRFS
ncbi:MAG: [Fe-Fe] hydrogenase large subunit C-terminal domain-containing protein [Bacillota bacterium]|uniref:[Fe-Fe] hydrogenase large subunit C-terminal domain-containing protein n=1 Tax=Desulfurispora thermophila TaxID=265470 RepID=UPI00035F14EE|nr:[Fe-Fe] hydrogenase large subunit C-terminal domain-containing protein [Desulfurispora thermophila]